MSPRQVGQLRRCSPIRRASSRSKGLLCCVKLLWLSRTTSALLKGTLRKRAGLVHRQKGLVIRLRAAGVNTLDAQRILWLLEFNLKQLEDHRDRLRESLKEGLICVGDVIRSALASIGSYPNLPRLALHRWRRRVLDLEPVIDAARTIVRAEPLRDDAFAAERAGMPEDASRRRRAKC